MFQTHRGRSVRSGHLPRVSGGERRTEVQAEGAGLRSQPDAQARTDGKLPAPPCPAQSPWALLGSPSQDGRVPGPEEQRGFPWAGPCRLTVARLCCVCRADTSMLVLCAVEAEQEP